MEAIKKISIHALREESDLVLPDGRSAYGLFLSTLSVRRATPSAGHRRQLLSTFLSTLSVRRATALRWHLFAPARISIHALREESDLFFTNGI